MRPLVAFAVLAVLLGAVALAILRPREATPSSPPAYMGRAVCAGCHARQDAAFRGSHHDLALQPAEGSAVLGDFSGATLQHGGITSTFFLREGRPWVRTDGQDGQLHDWAVRYAIGVSPLQQYLVDLPGGRLQTLSLCWDSRPEAQGGQRWFHLYPGETILAGDPLHWTGPSQCSNSQCAECHTTGFVKGWDDAAERYATTWRELGVSCEACHGPGAAHVAWAKANGGPEPSGCGLVVALEPPGQWVFDPGARTARREPPRRGQTELDACAPCHSRRTALVSEVLPGQPFLDSCRPVLLDPGLYAADGQIQEEVYEWGSFVQSKMHSKGVTCSDCHEPHGLGLRAPGNALCTRCHQAPVFDTPAHHFHREGTPGARCVDCHMPPKTYMVVDERRDHGLRVPRPDLAVALGVPHACQGCHADRGAQWAADAVAAHHPLAARRPHFAPSLHAGRGHALDARQRLMTLAADATQPALARASALAQLGRLSAPPPREALAAALGEAEPLLRLGALLGAQALDPSERAQLAASRLRDPARAVRIEAASLLADPAPERDAYLRAHEDQAWAWVERGTAADARGEAAAAEAAYRRALRRAPWSVEASVNLADSLRAQRRDAEGEQVLRAALRLVPGSAELQHALGLCLSRLGRSGVLAALAEAVRLRPGEPRFAHDYGVALCSLGHPEQGLEVLEQAQARLPGDPTLPYALATLRRDRGEVQAALRSARALLALTPQDPAARRLVAELEAAAARK